MQSVCFQPGPAAGTVSHCEAQLWLTEADGRLNLLQESAEFELLVSGKLPEGWEDALPTFTPEDKGLATRLHSQTMLNALSSVLPG